MRPLALLAVGLFVGSVAAAPVSKEKEKDEEAIVGTWKVEKYDVGEEDKERAERATKGQMTFTKDGKLTMTGDGKSREMEYKLDPTARPKGLVMTGDGYTVPALYELDGDTLTICTQTSAKEGEKFVRPDGLKADARKGVALLTLKRVKGLPANDPPASAEVTTALQPYLDQYKLAGYVAVIADKGGKVRYRNVAGYADVEAKKATSEDNVFWVASMSKMFAGASVMMLVDEGKLSLDDPVTKYIPQLEKWMVVEEKDKDHVLLKPPVRPVTIRHLLSHTSGLAGSSELQQVTGSDSTPLKARALSSVTGPLQSQPGDKYAYGNQGMNVAARVVEIVSGMAYEDFLQKRFFDPLGMKETTFWPSDTQVARFAGAYGPNKDKTGYARGGIGFLTKPLSDRTRRYPEAGGGLFSTTHDILRYGLMLANDGELDGKRYLSREAMGELRKEQTGKTKVNYSLGYHLRNGMFGHDGAYGTDLSVDPKTGMVAVFMIQCTSGDQWAARDLFLKTAAKVYPK